MSDNISNYDIIIVSLSYYQFSVNTGIRTGADFVMAQDIPSELDGQATLIYKVISSQTGARYGAYIGLRKISDSELRITEINADSIKAIKDISIFGLVTK